MLSNYWMKYGSSAVSVILNNHVLGMNAPMSIAFMNFTTREYFLQFVHGCNFAWPHAIGDHDGDGDEGYQHRGTAASIVRCFSFHYWIRSVAEFIHI